MKIKILLIAFVTTLIISCDKSINGVVIDNFGMPITEVEISIPNSEFKAQTDKDGFFKLDYVPGQFDIEFNKSGHLSTKKSLNISVKEKYPLGKIEMIRTPKDIGLYFVDKDDYVKLSGEILECKKIRERSPYSFSYKKIDKYYFPNKINGLSLKCDTMQEIVFLDYSLNNIYLTLADNDGFLFKLTQGLFTNSGETRGCFVRPNIEKIEKGIRFIKIKPQSCEEKYSFVEISQNSYGEDFTKGIGYCFKFDKK